MWIVNLIKWYTKAWLTAVVILIAVTGVISVIVIGIDRYEIHECNVWQEESTEFIGWYATDWQVEQCKHHSIELHPTQNEYFGDHSADY